MFCSNSKILFEADNGLELKKKINRNNLPDIILMDMNMPLMNGVDAVKWLNINFPAPKILVISMYESEATIIQMLKLGVKGYLCKNEEPQKLIDALYTIHDDRFYYSNFITRKLIHSLQIENNIDKEKPANIQVFNSREKILLTHACSDLTYKEIADQMCLSLKSIEKCQKSLFEKLHIKNRVGLALYAVKKGIVKL